MLQHLDHRPFFGSGFKGQLIRRIELQQIKNRFPDGFHLLKLPLQTRIHNRYLISFTNLSAFQKEADKR